MTHPWAYQIVGIRIIDSPLLDSMSRAVWLDDGLLVPPVVTRRIRAGWTDPVEAFDGVKLVDMRGGFNPFRDPLPMFSVAPTQKGFAYDNPIRP